MNLATARPPGNGTKAITSARTKPSTRQPTVEPTASQTVVVSAERNDAESKTSPYGASEVPPPSGLTDCWTTRANG